MVPVSSGGRTVYTDAVRAGSQQRGRAGTVREPFPVLQK